MPKAIDKEDDSQDVNGALRVLGQNMNATSAGLVGLI